MIPKLIEKAKQMLSDYLVALTLFAVVFFAFQWMKSQQDAELLKAMQTIERIKLKWTLIEE